MIPKKVPFYKTKEFKIFLTIWIVYAFYLQMFGASSMANTQSALTASIVNQGKFEIDTYHKAGGDGNAFYKGHYYSGQAPGISFISVPVYFISKQAFDLLPDKIIDALFEKLESYGGYLPKDWKGEKKVLSNFFVDLDKRQILEYVIISGFILPIFTTALIMALSVVLIYSILKYFTSDSRLRMLITIFYAFGTLIFPLSTEFFERPIAIAIIFASFYILFRAKHVISALRESTIFLAGFLAGLSVTFDYFHILLVGLLSLYMLNFLIDKKSNGPNKIKSLIYFLIGISIPLLLLGLYHYSIFDSPFATSYTYRDNPDSNSINPSKLSNIILPDSEMIFNMVIFFIYSPIVIFAMYGLYMALTRKNKYFEEAVLCSAAILAIFAFSTIVVLSLQSAHPLAQASFKRYLTPMIPFIFLFIPYSFQKQKMGNNKMKLVFLVLGTVSVFMNWLSAQFGGHGALGHFSLDTMKFTYISHFLETGPSSSFLSALSNVFGLSSFVVNLISLAVLVLVVYLIWKPKSLINTSPR
jgi:hypothetical protein